MRHSDFIFFITEKTFPACFEPADTVRKHMNRISIDEDGQNEILDVQKIRFEQEFSGVIMRALRKSVSKRLVCTFVLGSMSIYAMMPSWLEHAIIQGSKSNKIIRTTVNLIQIHRKHLVTKEEMENIYLQKVKKDDHGQIYGEASLGDDLENMLERKGSRFQLYLSLNFVVQSFESIQNDTLEDGLRPLFFLQKLTSHQKKLIEEKHDNALKFHIIPSLRPSPDISPDVMKKSESKFWLDQIKTTFEGKVLHIW